MSPVMYVRLWLMVFLHYFVWSSWYVTMGKYLGSLNFSNTQIGLAYGTIAVGAMVAPFFAGIVADRFFASQRLLGCLHLIGAGLLYSLPMIKTFPLFYTVLLMYAITYMAAHGLTNTITLHHSKNPAKEFPIVMFMASVGWIAAGLTVGWLNLGDSPNMFRLAATVAAIVGVYSFTLPDTPPKGAGAPVTMRTMLGLDALKLMSDRSFATFIICSFLICIPLSFYFTHIYVYLTDHKVPNAASILTVGQVSDVVFLMLLPYLLKRLGVKGILLVGITAWAVRFGLFGWADTNNWHWMMYVGIALHGMCYDYIFVMGRMYVDSYATPDIRGAAQGFHAFVTLGAGMFVGTWLAGAVGDHYSHKTIVDGVTTVTHDWQPVWLIPAGLSLLLGVLFAFIFHERPAKATGDAA